MGSIPGAKAKADELKRQPGAYISREGKYLYRVVGPNATGMLLVENAMTGKELALTSGEVTSAKLVRAPERLVVPDYPPDTPDPQAPPDYTN